MSKLMNKSMYDGLMTVWAIIARINTTSVVYIAAEKVESDIIIRRGSESDRYKNIR